MTMRACLTAFVAAAALCGLDVSLAQQPPTPRPQQPEVVDIEHLFAEANMLGEVGAILFRLDDGSVVDVLQGGRSFPPASTVKILAAARALQTMGTRGKFTTRLVADGELGRSGVLDGDLVLLGGGDPTLDNNDLAWMVDALREKGLREVRGRFLFDDTALPKGDRIDPDQRDHISVNTGYGGLNLNFNRARLYGERNDDGILQGRLSAYADGFEVDVDSMHVVVHPNDGDPTVEYNKGKDGEYWIVEEQVLDQARYIWLPVRDPGAYAAAVFRSIARGQGLKLPPPERGSASSEAVELVAHDSESIARIAAETLFYSNNLAAEILSLAAARYYDPPPHSLEDVAQTHVKALLGEEGDNGVRLLNLSGLSERSRITPLAFREILLRLLDPQLLPDADIRFVVPTYDLKAAEAGLRDSVIVQAKSGTLHFVRSLVGYLHGSSCGRDFGFAIFITDLDQRDALYAELDIPVAKLTSKAPRLWRLRAQKLERDILVNWIRRYGCG